VFNLETTNRDYSKTLGTLKQVQRDAYRDIINGTVIVIITLAFSIATLYILTFARTDISSISLSIIETIISLIVLYVSISRLALMFWDSWRITGYPAFSLKDMNNRSHDAKLYGLLKREDKTVRKIINLATLSITLIYLQFSSKIHILTSVIEIPKIFVSEPILIFLPLHVVILFSIAHNIPFLAALHEKIKGELDSATILFRGNICPICEKVIPNRSVHCPYCGACIKEAGEASVK